MNMNYVIMMFEMVYCYTIESSKKKLAILNRYLKNDFSPEILLPKKCTLTPLKLFEFTGFPSEITNASRLSEYALIDST